VTIPAKPALLDDTWFAAPLCRNCGAALAGPHCAACGQKKVARIGVGALRTEIWEKLRLFELDQLRSALRLLGGPGHVARDYVCGVRKQHTHPLKLLLLAIAALLLVLAQTRYLHSSSASVSRAMELLRKYAEWSFSLGLFAIWAASLAAFRRRLGYNAVEHLVLAVYCQFLIILANIANQLPLLLWRAPFWLAWHKHWSPRYMDVIEVAIVLVGCRQFFLVDLRWREWRRQSWRLLLAALIFLLCKYLLLQLYARVLARLVISGTLA
jgi:Protein of unknown function (DUF3667)